nr:hypothetical protein CFP56_44720 [Quercus suber]
MKGLLAFSGDGYCMCNWLMILPAYSSFCTLILRFGPRSTCGHSTKGALPITRVLAHLRGIAEQLLGSLLAEIGLLELNLKPMLRNRTT